MSSNTWKLFKTNAATPDKIQTVDAIKRFYRIAERC